MVQFLALAVCHDGLAGDRPEHDSTEAFYPTTDLVTGPDIIFFWVARMIMAGYEFMGDLPFRNVYFTGIIRDKQGRKMSKTLGNSPDPLELIAKYGADALRFGTMRSAPLGQDVLFDEKDVELGRNFCNKLWNACRFRQMQGSAPDVGATAAQTAESRRNQSARLTRRQMDSAQARPGHSRNHRRVRRIQVQQGHCRRSTVSSGASIATGMSRRARPCSRQGEAATRNAEQEAANTLAVIDFVLGHTLRLFHPFLPFITEELWHGMGYRRTCRRIRAARPSCSRRGPSLSMTMKRRIMD